MGAVWDPDAPNVSKQVIFEQSSVRQMHKNWFKTVHWHAVKKLCPEPTVTWDWYSQQITFSGEEPYLTFIRSEKMWSYDLHRLLSTHIEKLPFLKEWEEQPSDALFFPLIGRFGVVYKPPMIPEGDCLVKYTKEGEPVVISTVEVWAARFSVTGFEEIDYGRQ